MVPSEGYLFLMLRRMRSLFSEREVIPSKIRLINYRLKVDCEALFSNSAPGGVI